MAVSQSPPQHAGGGGWIVVGVIILGLFGALWCGMQATTALFSTPMTWAQYAGTLYTWRTPVVYKTTVALSHPLAWHVIAVVASVVAIVLELAAVEKLWRWWMRRRVRHNSGGYGGEPRFVPPHRDWQKG